MQNTAEIKSKAHEGLAHLTSYCLVTKIWSLIEGQMCTVVGELKVLNGENWFLTEGKK